MKKPSFRALPALLAAAAFLGLVLDPAGCSAAAAEGLSLAFTVLFPALFPFFVVSSLLLRLGWADRLGRAAAPVLAPLLGVDGVFAAALLLGLAGGYPVGARSVAALCESGACSRAEAEHALAFCNNAGPAFILGAVGGGLFHSAAVGLALLAVHAASALLTGLLFRRAAPRITAAAPCRHAPAERFAPAFTASVTSSFAAALNVAAFVVFFAVVTRLLTLSGLLPLASRALALLPGVSPAVADALLAGAVELTGGLAALAARPVSRTGALVCASALLAWGGLSVHMQTLSVLGDTGLSPRLYFRGKLTQTALAAALTALLSPLLRPDAVPAAALVPAAPRAAFFVPAAAIGLLFAALLVKKGWKSGG